MPSENNWTHISPLEGRNSGGRASPGPTIEGFRATNVRQIDTILCSLFPPMNYDSSQANERLPLPSATACRLRRLMWKHCLVHRMAD